MNRRLRLRVRLRAKGGGATQGAIRLRGEGPSRILLARRVRRFKGEVTARLKSKKCFPRKVQKLSLDIHWTAEDEAVLTPERTKTTVYVTMARPRVFPGRPFDEEGVTLQRMDKAVEWVEAMDTLSPHAIVEGLMEKFPYYALLPSPKVPAEYHHPTYFNEHGGAWPMAEHIEASGECQAIVRLIRGVLFQVGVPGSVNAIVVWADPRIKGGRKPLFADQEEKPEAGLDATSVINGRPAIAALVDAPVEEGKAYPPSHTRMRGGRLSPGLNRYEACLKLSHRGRTRYYAGGAGVFESKERILEVFWGLIWVTFRGGGEEGYTVEKIVHQYRD